MKIFTRVALLFCSISLGGGCATSECLQLPVSTKISDAAVARCQLEAHQSPGRRDLFDRATRLAWARGLYEEMVSLSKWVLRHDKTRSDARYYLAVGLRKLGQCDSALRHYEAYATLRPSDPDPHFGMALCHEALGNKQAAVAAFGAYLAREKRPDREAWRAKARGRVSRLESPAPMEGRASLAPRVAKSASPAAGRAKRVPPAARVERPAPPAPKPAPPPPAACGRHEKAFKADPFATKAYDAFASCALGRKEYQKVVMAMRMAIRDNPNFSRGWLQLGRAYAGLGRKAEAGRALARACKAGVSEACNN